MTTDDRANFADGLDTGGDVNASWTVLTNPTVTGPPVMTFTTQGDSSVLAGGTIPAQGVYIVSYTTAISGITGIRLEALEDPSLPQDGPGFFSFNGNFALTEITVDATPTVVVGGSVTGMSPSDGKVTCLNKTTRQRVNSTIPAGVRSWDCEQAGLVVNTGDTIQMKIEVTGPAD